MNSCHNIHKLFHSTFHCVSVILHEPKHYFHQTQCRHLVVLYFVTSSMLNRFFSFSPHITVKTVCLSNNNCFFTKKKKHTNNCSHDHRVVGNGTSLRTHNLITMVAMATSVWFTHTYQHIIMYMQAPGNIISRSNKSIVTPHLFKTTKGTKYPRENEITEWFWSYLIMLF